MATVAAPPSAAQVVRRRQRSTRLTVAVVLVLLSAAAVTGAILSGAWAWLVVAALAAVVLGGAAVRITHSELVQTRRDAARDRADQAREYADITAVRTAENIAFADSMRSEVEQRQLAITELEQALVAAQQRAADTTRKLGAEARRADVAEITVAEVRGQLDDSETRAAEAIVLVAELEMELDALRAELDSVTLAWREADSVRHRA